MTTREPRVLAVTSVGSSSGAVTPVLAALEATDMTVRAIDIGRAGSRADGTIDRVMRAFSGELAERRLTRELTSNPPDVTIAFDPGSTVALTVARDVSPQPAPVIAVVGELAPVTAWSETDADRYLAVDDEAAVALEDHGVEPDRILVVGPLSEHAWAEAASADLAAVRRKFKIGAGHVVLIRVAGMPQETVSQLALQLSLLGGEATYLFDAGDDAVAATTLRRQVPALGMRAKLFGDTTDAAQFWRCADAVVIRPHARWVARALAVGARIVAFLPEAGRGVALAKALEERGLATTAGNSLLLSAAIDTLLEARARSDSRIGVDGAGNVADVAWVVGSQRREVIEERRSAARAETHERVRAAASAAEQAAKFSAAAGGLEDLSGDVDVPPPDAAPPDAHELGALRAEVQARIGQVGRTVEESRAAADRWDRRRSAAAASGDDDQARTAERNADVERARMHAALAEMAQLSSELDQLERAVRAAAAAPGAAWSAGASASSGSSSSRSGAGARSSASGKPSVDDLLDQLKRQAGGASSRSSTSRSGRSGRSGRSSGSSARGSTNSAPKSSIDDELEALKRKMNSRKKP